MIAGPLSLPHGMKLGSLGEALLRSVRVAGGGGSGGDADDDDAAAFEDRQCASAWC